MEVHSVTGEEVKSAGAAYGQWRRMTRSRRGSEGGKTAGHRTVFWKWEFGV